MAIRTAVTVTAGVAVAQFFVLLGIGWAIGRLLRLPRGVLPVVALAAAFPNSGNYGIPLVELAFGPGFVMHQAVITSMHAILIVAVGVPLLTAGRGGYASALADVFRTPLIPAIVVGLLLKGFDVPAPAPLAVPLAVIAGALTPVALFTLGAQLATLTYAGSRLPFTAGLVMRLAVAPLLTAAALIALPVAPTLFELLVITACAPVGALLPILFAEFATGPDAEANTALASAMVAVSTALSPFVVTAALVLSRL